MKTIQNSLAILAGSTIVAGGFAMPVLAQDEEPVDLGTLQFEVEGAEPVGQNLDPLTLTGIKSATPLTEVPQSVSVIGREEIAETNTGKIDRALVGTAGVQSQLYGFDSDTNWFYIRGFNATDTGAFMDGLSLFSYAFGTFYIDPFLLERVEVLKGPASMLYGASNPGGVVNYVSRLPDGSEGGQVELGADSEGRAWASAEKAGVVNDTLAYRFGAKVTRQDGHGMFEPGWEGTLYGGATKAFDDGGKLTLHFSYQKMDEDHVGNQFMPYFGTEAPAPFGYFDEDYNPGEPDQDEYTRDQLMLTGIYRRDLAGWEMTNTARIGYAHVKERYAYPYGYTDPAGVAFAVQDPATGQVNRIGFTHNSLAQIMQNDLRMTREFETAAMSHDLLLGLDARYYQIDEEQAGFAVNPLDAVNPVYGGYGGDSAPYIDQVQTQTQLGIYAQDQIRWGDGWLATLNVRYDTVWTNVDDNLGAPSDLSRKDDAFTYRIALSRTFGNVTPYVTYGTYFNPQVLGASTRDAKPEEGRQLEAGLKWAPTDYALITLSAFDIHRENVSQNRINGGVFDNRTLGEVRSRGLELEARGQITDEWAVNASYTHMDVDIDEFADDPSLEGKTPQSVVEQFGALGITYSPLAVEGLKLRLGARYQGDSWADNANQYKVGDVWLYDAGVSYDFAGDWTANLDVSNLTDEDYTASCQTSFGISSCWRGEGRLISLALRRSF